MSFTLKPKRSVAKELSRVARRELDDTAEELDSSKRKGPAVHEARKSTKKVRAVLRLVRDGMGRDYRRANRRLRKISRALSALRDVDALTATVQSLHRRYPAIFTDEIQRDVVRVVSARQRVVRRELSGRVRAARRVLEATRESVPRDVRHAGHRSVVHRGLVDGYRLARRALQPLALDAPASEFHAWRRRTKNHWYHMRLFEQRHQTAAKRVVSLKQLQRWLGGAHDLELLRLALDEAPGRSANARARRITLECIDKFQEVLNRRSLTLGRRLFQRRPGLFKRSVANW